MTASHTPAEPGTPLPWRLDRSESDRRTIRAASNSVQVAYGIKSAKDARYIVTACNAFPDLVEALEWAVNHFEGRTRENAEQLSNCIDKCAAALAKAKEPST